MIITKEQQEAWISNYAKEATDAELFGFIDGIEKIMEVIGQAEPDGYGWRRPTWQELTALQLIKEKYTETDAEFINQVRRMGLETRSIFADTVHVREVNPEPKQPDPIDWGVRRYELVRSVAAEFFRVADHDTEFNQVADAAVTFADCIIEKLKSK